MSTRVPRLPARIARAASALTKPQRTAPPMGVQPSKIGPMTSTNRDIATAPTPSAHQGQAETRTFAQTYFTKISLGETQVLYNGDRQWALVTVELETAGPVVVGLVQKLTPVLSGKGIRLTTGQEKTFRVAKGSRLWIASTSVNRVKLTVEPFPWLEQITGLLRGFVGKLMGR